MEAGSQRAHGTSQSVAVRCADVAELQVIHHHDKNFALMFLVDGVEFELW